MAAPGPQEPRQPEVERAFEHALGELLDRRPQLCESVAGQMREADPSLLLPLVRQLARPRTPRQLELLADQLGRVPGADALLLGEIERAASGATLSVARRVRPRVRSLLGSADPLTCLAACRAVAALEDPEAVEALIVLLGSDHQALQAAALGSLERLTQRRLGPEAEPWSDWYAAEIAWWSGDAQRELLAVRRRVPRELAPAVMGLARGGLFREEIAPALTPLLRHRDPDVARLTASVLSTLGTRAALPALADVLAHADPAVAEGAHKALRRITGRDLGPDPDAWLALPH
jgi:HEAT repeat protein